MGDTTFVGDVTFSVVSDSFTVNNALNHPTLTFEGDLSAEESGGPLGWVVANGRLVFA